MSKNSKTLYVAIDIEASGYFAPEHFIKAIGAYAVDEDGKEISTFTVNLKAPLGRVVEKRCKEEFWDKHPGLWEELSLDEIPHYQGIARFWNWLRGLKSFEFAEMKLVSDFCEFDIAWLSVYMTTFLHEPPLYYLEGTYIGGALNVDDFVRGLLRIPKEWSPFARLREECEKRGLQNPPKGDHHPLNDAREIGIHTVNAMKICSMMKSE